MDISEGIEIIDLALWLKKEKILVISDFHLGYEERLKEEGILMPRFQLEDILERLKKIFRKIKLKPEKIIINGDLKQEFGRILNQEGRDSLRLVDFLLGNSRELILVKGNHDTFLGPIAGKRNLKVVEDCRLRDILITHGDKIKKISKKVKTIIIGHEHPAVGLREKGKVEKYKCFLKGKFEGKKLIVLPSFNLLLEGTDILKEELLSPYLKEIADARKGHKPFPASRKSLDRDFQDFEVYVVGKKIYQFGKVKHLTKLS